MESDINVSTLIEKGRLEEKIEMLHKTIRHYIYKNLISSALIVEKKRIQKIHADIKQSELYKHNIFLKFVKKSLSI